VKEVALPYKTGSSDCWRLGLWRRVAGETEAELPVQLEDWDYSVPLALSCVVTVNVSKLREETGASAEDALALVAVWEASSTGIRELGAKHELPPDGEASFELVIHLEGSRIGGRLVLDRQVVLTAEGATNDPLAARAVGSILLAELPGDRTSVLLEGDAARFPSEVIDFAQLPIAEPSALWYLELDTTDLDQAPLSVMRLYLNGGHPAVSAALGGTGGAGEIVQSVIRWDVARALLHRALDNDDFVADWDSFHDESLGMTLQRLIQRYWPAETGVSLRAKREVNPARFEYQLQARMRLLEGVS
jgi:hypothetical protein